jgi:scyllo-inositol 2-dehydrogenase (NADP+)
VFDLETVNVGIIGYGFSASIFHVPILETIAGYCIKEVVSSDPDKVHRDLPNVRVVETSSELFNNPEVNLVVITTPNTLHYPLAKQALMAGKHVVIDKPFVVDASEGEDLLRAAKEQNKLLSVYHNRRWDNDFLTLKKTVESGVLGNIRVFESHFDRFRPQVRKRWREEALPGSGLLYDLGPHLVDQALCLFGLPRTVNADVSIMRKDGQADDYFHVILGYDNLRVILHASTLVMEQGPRFQVHGDKGSFIKYGLDSQEALLKEGHKPGDLGWGYDTPNQFASLTTGIDTPRTVKLETIPGAYETYYYQLHDAICSHGKVPVLAQAGLDTIRIIECAVRSSANGKRIDFR